jgi:serine/threonine kinase 38
MASSTESPLRFSCHTLDKATKAKVTLENYYSNLISQHRERRERLRRLEESLQVTREIEEIGGELTGNQRD